MFVMWDTSVHDKQKPNEEQLSFPIQHLSDLPAVKNLWWNLSAYLCLV